MRDERSLFVCQEVLCVCVEGCKGALVTIQEDKFITMTTLVRLLQV